MYACTYAHGCMHVCVTHTRMHACMDVETCMCACLRTYACILTSQTKAILEIRRAPAFPHAWFNNSRNMNLKREYGSIKSKEARCMELDRTVVCV